MEPARPVSLDNGPLFDRHIEGVSQGFIPDLMRFAPIDGYIKVTGDEAREMTRRLSREFGLLVGTSSGANVAAALRLAQTREIEGKLEGLERDPEKFAAFLRESRAKMAS